MKRLLFLFSMLLLFDQLSAQLYEPMSTWYEFYQVKFKNHLQVPFLKKSTADSALLAYGDRKLWIKTDIGWEAVGGADVTKVPLTRTITINGTAYDLTIDRNWTIAKADVGLGSADNTSDLNKPLSTAQKAALDDSIAAVRASFPVVTATNGATKSGNDTRLGQDSLQAGNPATLQSTREIPLNGKSLFLSGDAGRLIIGRSFGSTGFDYPAPNDQARFAINDLSEGKKLFSIGRNKNGPTNPVLYRAQREGASIFFVDSLSSKTDFEAGISKALDVTFEQYQTGAPFYYNNGIGQSANFAGHFQSFYRGRDSMYLDNPGGDLIGAIKGRLVFSPNALTNTTNNTAVFQSGTFKADVQAAGVFTFETGSSLYPTKKVKLNGYYAGTTIEVLTRTADTIENLYNICTGDDFTAPGSHISNFHADVFVSGAGAAISKKHYGIYELNRSSPTFNANRLYHDLIISKTSDVPLATLHVDGKGLFTDTLTITTLGNSDSSNRAASTAWMKRVIAGFSGGSGGGIVNLNGLTNSSQSFDKGTSGTDINWSSVSGVHTLNVPDASTSARGVITTGAQTIAGAKNFTSSITNTVDGDIIHKRTTNTNALNGIAFQTSAGLERAFIRLNQVSGEFRFGTTSGSYFPTFYSNGSEAGRFTTAGLFALGGGATSSFPALGRSGATLQVRLADNSADAALSASGLTLSGLSGTGTRLGTVSSTGVAGTVTNGSDGQLMTMVSGSPAWANNTAVQLTGNQSVAGVKTFTDRMEITKGAVTPDVNNLLYLGRNDPGNFYPLFIIEDKTDNGYAQFGYWGKNRKWNVGVGNGPSNFFGVEDKYYILDAIGNNVRFVIDPSGRTGIGGITSPTAFLHLPAGTTDYASLRIPETSVDPAFPNAGEIWNRNGQVTVRTGGANKVLNDFDGGVYNPTFSNLGTGVSSVTATNSKVWWTRVGKVVTITGRVDPVFSSGIAGDSKTFSMSLPPGITVNFTSNNDGQGVANCTFSTTRTAIVQADATNDIILFTVTLGSEGFGASAGVHFTMSFQIP